MSARCEDRGVMENGNEFHRHMVEDNLSSSPPLVPTMWIITNYNFSAFSTSDLLAYVHGKCAKPHASA